MRFPVRVECDDNTKAGMIKKEKDATNLPVEAVI